MLKGSYVSEKKPHLTLLESMVVGSVASVAGWLLSYPQDVIKTKLQVESVGRYKSWKWLPDGGILDCSRDILSKRGWAGFFAGLSPCLVRACYS